MNPRSVEAIGRRLRHLRTTLDLNQTEFAKFAGLAQNAYSQYENGQRRPSLEAAFKMCDRYKVTLDWIYQGVSDGLPNRLWQELDRAATRRSNLDDIIDLPAKRRAD